MEKLTKDQIRVLRDIDTLGLKVMWSYRVPTATFDDGMEMTREDWRIVDQQLIQRPIRQVAMPDGGILEYEAEESEWIKRDKIDADEYAEEFGGLLYRYSLTNKAKEVLKTVEGST